VLGRPALRVASSPLKENAADVERRAVGADADAAAPNSP
jgi:hypothetical protein